MKALVAAILTNVVYYGDLLVKVQTLSATNKTHMAIRREIVVIRNPAIRSPNASTCKFVHFILFHFLSHIFLVHYKGISIAVYFIVPI